MTAPVVFVDTETTGLDPEVHEVWDIAIIEADGREHEFHVRPRLTRASPDALRITGYYERAFAWDVSSPLGWRDPRTAARDVAKLTSGMHLVGAVPSFDAAFLAVFLRSYDLAPAWHYHLVDVEALAAGKLGVEPPWETAVLAARLGINPDLPEFEKHTALGDARWAKRMYEKALGL